MFRLHSYKNSPFVRLLRKNKSAVAVATLVGGLWFLGIFASTDLWRTAVPSIRVVGARAPIQIVMTPSLYHRIRAVHHTRHFVSKKRSARHAKEGVQVNAGIRKRHGVELSAKQAGFVQKLGQYLHTQGETATVTSGTRSPAHQLAIIKSKVRSLGGSGRFPELRKASVGRTASWLRAWQWLRAKHVPVYAPASVPGVYAETSNHIRGMAVDLIGGSLDRLSGLITKFSHSTLAMHSPLRVLSIAREAGCVHINLAAK